MKRVQFTVALDECRAHLFNVTMTIEGAVNNQRISLPTWSPGSYMIREFAQHIFSLSAMEDGHPISAEKINKNTFELGNKTAHVTVCFRIYGFDSSIRAAFIDDNQAFFNGTALFFRPHGLENASYTLMLTRPTDSLFKDWQVATSMPAIQVDSSGFGSYASASYDELVDYPCQISPMKRLAFSAAGVPHEMVLVGDVRPFDETRLAHDVAKLCEHQINMFGGAPFSSYLFIARFAENGHGGLEHRNSSMLLSTPYGLPKKDGEPDRHYRDFLSLCSHEYFHAWNVKRLKPTNFIPYDFDKECYTKMLWMFEGITSYYDDLVIRRAGLISTASYLDLMSKNYSKLLRTKGRHVQSVAESSFDAWIKFYRQNENSINASVSYYLKGSFIALYLDLLMRSNTSNRVTLDTIMCMAYEKYGQEKGITEEQFLGLIHSVSDIDVESFKEDYIYGVKELPLAEILDRFGIEMSVVADELSFDDKTKMSCFLGMRLRFDDNGRGLVSFVEQQGPAMMAGISAADEIIAINNVRFDETNSADLLGSLRIDQHVDILCARKKSLRNVSVIPTALPLRMVKFLFKQKPTDFEKNSLENWLIFVESNAN